MTVNRCTLSLHVYRMNRLVSVSRSRLSVLSTRFTSGQSSRFHRFEPTPLTGIYKYTKHIWAAFAFGPVVYYAILYFFQNEENSLKNDENTLKIENRM